MNKQINSFFSGIFLGRIIADTKYNLIISYLMHLRAEILFIRCMMLYATIILFFKFHIDTVWIRFQCFLEILRIKILWAMSDCTTIGMLKMEYTIKNFFAYWQGFGDGLAIGIVLAIIIYFRMRRKSA